MVLLNDLPGKQILKSYFFCCGLIPVGNIVVWICHLAGIFSNFSAFALLYMRVILTREVRGKSDQCKELSEVVANTTWKERPNK